MGGGVYLLYTLRYMKIGHLPSEGVHVQFSIIQPALFPLLWEAVDCNPKQVLVRFNITTKTRTEQES